MRPTQRGLGFVAISITVASLAAAASLSAPGVAVERHARAAASRAPSAFDAPKREADRRDARAGAITDGAPGASQEARPATVWTGPWLPARNGWR